MGKAQAVCITLLLDRLNSKTLSEKEQLYSANNLVNFLLQQQFKFLEKNGFQSIEGFAESQDYLSFKLWSSMPVDTESILTSYENWDSKIVTPDVAYGVGRLIAGLATANRTIRLSFVLSLTGLLRVLHPFLSFRILISLMFQKLGKTPLGPPGVPNTEDWIIGRIFFCSALIRARFFSDISNLSLVKLLLDHIFFECIPVKSPTSLMFADIFAKIVQQIPASYLPVSIEPKIYNIDSITSTEQFYILLILYTLIDDKEKFKDTTSKLLLSGGLNEDLYKFYHFKYTNLPITSFFKHVIKFFLSTTNELFITFWDKIIMHIFLVQKSTAKIPIFFDILIVTMEGPNLDPSIIEHLWGNTCNIPQKYHNLLHRQFRECINSKDLQLKSDASNALTKIFSLAQELSPKSLAAFKTAMSANHNFWISQNTSASKLWSSLWLTLLISTTTPQETKQILLQLDYQEPVPLFSLNMKFLHNFIIRNKKTLDQEFLVDFSTTLFIAVVRVFKSSAFSSEFKMGLYSRFRSYLSIVFLYPSENHKSVLFTSSEKGLHALISLFASFLAILGRKQLAPNMLKLENCPRLLSVQLLILILEFIYSISIDLKISGDIDHDELEGLVKDSMALLSSSKKNNYDDKDSINRLVDIILACISMNHMLFEGPVRIALINWQDRITQSSVRLIVDALIDPLAMEEADHANGRDDDDDDDNEDGENDEAHSSENNNSYDNDIDYGQEETCDSQYSSYHDELADIPLESVTEEDMNMVDESFKNVASFLNNNKRNKEKEREVFLYQSRLFTLLSYMAEHFDNPVRLLIYNYAPTLINWLNTQPKTSMPSDTSKFKEKGLSTLRQWERKLTANK